jgi:tetratricopeptide (TPR) repeat protein
MTDNLAAFEAYLAANEAEGVETKRQLLGRAVELDPEFAAGWAALAGIEVMPVWNGQVAIAEAWPRAKPSLDRAFELDPDLPSAFVTLGRFQRELGDIEAAIASFDRALQLDPGYGSASANLGLALRFSGRYEAALAVHETAAAMDPLSPAVQTRLGTSYWFIGDFESAARHYQIAIDLNPSYEESYDSWAGMLGAGLGRFDEALAMIQRKMALPGEPTVRTLATAGTLSSILGMDAAAHEYWRRGREINPEYASIYSDMARHHLLRGDDPAARQAAQAALERFPLDTQAQLVLAILDLENGNADAFVQRVGTAYADYMGDPPVIDRAHLDIALLIALAYDAAGAQADKLRVLQEMDAAVETPRAGQYVSLAAMHAMRNEPESALRDLRNSPPGRVRLWAPLAMRDPRVAALRDDEAFRALISGHLEELKMQAVTTETARSVQPDRQPWRDSLRFTASGRDALPGPGTGARPRKRRPTTPD